MTNNLISEIIKQISAVSMDQQRVSYDVWLGRCCEKKKRKKLWHKTPYTLPYGLDSLHYDIIQLSISILSAHF